MKYLLIVLMTCLTISLYADDWPREVLSSEGTITMYQPQIESYSGNSLKARAAVSIMPIGKDEPVFGAIWVTCRVLTDRPTRTVKLEEMEVRRIRFPAVTDADTAKIAEALEEVIPRSDLTFSLDLLLESIETAQKERENAHDLDLKPPKIIIMNRPAVLVRIDGDPIFNLVEGTSLKRVVNTPFFLIQDLSSGKFFLHGGDLWFSANKIIGPWRRTAVAPRSIADLYDQMKSDNDFYEDSTANDVIQMTGKVPEIVVTTEPAELIATDGPMLLAPIKGTGLLYASNTPGRLFLEIKTQMRFVLISGRWYTASSLNGPWVFIASEKLPEDFKNIPPGSACDDVLASVAGTIPAKEAVFDAQIPQMAQVDRNENASDVEYDGDPQFEPIENTGMDYAVNTSTAVIRYAGLYFNCDRGIWFTGKSPSGPWMVCMDVPENIYTIPPSCPLYNVRYVRVYQHTENFVYVGYTAGYTGCYVYNRAIVYGTGYNYHSWYKRRYYARPWTWGFNVHYDPWTGWSLGAGWGHSRGWFAHSPKNVYAGWWGPGEYHPVYHPVAKSVYREGYHPVRRERESMAPIVRTPDEPRRIPAASRSVTLYDNRSNGVRRPGATQPTRTTTRDARQPENGPITRPLIPPGGQIEPQPIPKSGAPRDTRQPETQPITRPVPPPVAQPEPLPIPLPPAGRVPRQPETQPITRPVPPPVAQPEPQPVLMPPAVRAPRQPETQPITKPVPPPVAQPEPQPVPMPPAVRAPRQPETQPITRPVPPPVAQPEPRPVPMPPAARAPSQPEIRPPVVTRPSRTEDNVYAAPDGKVMRSTPQGWQQRDNNTWKKADETPGKQETIRDSEVRQRATERAATPAPAAAPAPVPVQKRNPDEKERRH